MPNSISKDKELNGSLNWKCVSCAWEYASAQLLSPFAELFPLTSNYSTIITGVTKLQWKALELDRAQRLILLSASFLLDVRPIYYDLQVLSLKLAFIPT